jgi:hypothetical protein
MTESNTTATTARLPYFKGMTDDELRAAYVAFRTLAYNAGEMANMCAPRSGQGRKVAANWGRSIRAMELIEAIARQRRISLRQPA